MICSCGCRKEFNPSRSTLWRLKTGRIREVFIQGHALKSINNGHWKGGETMSEQGYIMIRKPDHPNARKSGYILKHRFMMSEHLGRPLTNDEIVHHKNHNKLDNRIENFELHTRASHKLAHPEITTAKPKIPKICLTCGKKFIKKLSGNHNRAKFCSKKCRNTAGPQHPRRKANLSYPHYAIP